MKKLLPFATSLVLAFNLTAATPTILSTDIGSDVDDVWALAQILRSPELDLQFIITEMGESEYRAKVGAKYLEACDRSDVEVGLGIDFGKMADKDRHQGPWVEDYELSEYSGAIHQDGVSALLKHLQQTPGTINVIAIGPAPSLAAAIKQDPALAKRCRLLGMYGSFDRGYNGEAPPESEYNVRGQPDALRYLLSVEWKEVLITPLDTCGIVDLEGENYHAIWSSTQDPLLRALIENYCIWAPRVPWGDYSFFATKSSTLFDNVAVYMAYSTELLEFEEIQFDIKDDGNTVRDPDGPYKAKIAMEWTDLPAFEKHLTRRLQGLE
ncbi:MAG: nucleoside hydrolase [Verrucomicrobiota bacterium]